MNYETDILIFDSGVGGLSILTEVQRRLPQARLLFASDNAAYPYGTKPEDELISRVDIVIQSLISRYQPKIIIVACNSASTVCLAHLRQTIDIPIIGVVPAIKPAAQLSSTKTIGLLATPATIQRTYTQTLIDNYAPDCNVIKVGSSALVDIAEAKLSECDINWSELENILHPFNKNNDIDTLVLGCTHFPLLCEEISRALDKEITLIDSGAAIAQQVERIINEHSIPLRNGHTVDHQAVFTLDGLHAQHWAHSLHMFHIERIEFVAI